MHILYWKANCANAPVDLLCQRILHSSVPTVFSNFDSLDRPKLIVKSLRGGLGVFSTHVVGFSFLVH